MKNVYSCKSELLVGRKCNGKGGFTVLKSAGVGNLKSHLSTCIPSWQDIYDARNLGNADIRKHIDVDNTSQNMFHWIEWVITDNLPFSFVENERSRSNSKRAPLITTQSIFEHICILVTLD